MRPSISTSSAVVKRTALAMVWRWRNVVGERRLQQRLGVALRHLDEEAEDIVVADLQRLDAGRARCSAPPARPSRGGCRRSARRASSRSAGSPGARSRRRASGAAGRRPARARAPRRAPRRPRAARRRCARSSAGRPMPRRRRPAGSAQRARQPSPSRTAARSRGPPRPNASRETARAISGAALQRLAQVVAQRLRRRCRKPTASSRAVDAPRRRAAGSRAAPPARARRRPSRCGRWRRAGCPASRRTSSAPAPGWRGSRHRSAGRRRRRCAAAAAAPACAPICVSSTYLQQRADRRQLGAREAAEAAELGDT